MYLIALHCTALPHLRSGVHDARRVIFNLGESTQSKEGSWSFDRSWRLKSNFLFYSWQEQSPCNSGETNRANNSTLDCGMGREVMFQAITLRKGNVLVVSLIKQEMAEDATEDTVTYCMPNIYWLLPIVYCLLCTVYTVFTVNTVYTCYTISYSLFSQ